MRGIECVAPNCAHLHAEDDEQLVQAAMRHAKEVHSDMPFPESAAREFVQKGAYDDTQHAGDAGGSISG
jgi:predicted small metal-binding protein